MPDKLERDTVRKIAELVERVRTICREAGGNPDTEDRPPVACPICGAGSKFYVCSPGTEHVHFACPACGFRLSQ